MPAVWTSDQITGMAPDSASVAAGRKQAGAKKWQTLGRSEELLWGEIKGSGKNPYQVCIELAGPAFKCSCPSHKFPCKHALGLAYVYAEETAAVVPGEPPEWVQAWVDGRAQRALKKAERAAKAAESDTPETAAKKAAAQQKRAASRQEKVRAGVDELSRWLGDLVRQGLAAHASQPYSFWDQIASRMVDAQAPGLARWVRRLGELRYHSDWQSRTLDQIARIHLLLSAYRRIETLEPLLQAEVLAQIGFQQEKETVLEQECVSDVWLVMGEWTGEEDQLRVRRTWLRGTTSGITAFILDFAVHNQVFPAMPAAGAYWQAELAFYSGALLARALVKQSGGTVSSDAVELDAFTSFTDAQRAYGESLMQNPWLERYPILFNTVTSELVDGRWLLRDVNDAWIPVKTASPWHMLALTGGHACAIFGEWDGYEFLPISIFPSEPACEPRLEAA